MKQDVPRLRMFAGPNGSGKSTFKSIIGSSLLGIYINPDDIEKEIRKTAALSLKKYEISTSTAELSEFFQSSSLLQNSSLVEQSKKITVNADRVVFNQANPNGYFASALADFIRRQLIEERKSFTFETVMSFPDKIELLTKAQSIGYRTYLYYVATEDPEINISRIRHRVSMGGHDVPADKVISRYQRSLDLLTLAVASTNRAYIFDNSTHEHVWLAEITDGKHLEMKTDMLPAWFKKNFWNKLPSQREDKVLPSQDIHN